jgi:hypothetical protein
MFIDIVKIHTRINKWVVFIVREYVLGIGETADNCIVVDNNFSDWC